MPVTRIACGANPPYDRLRDMLKKLLEKNYIEEVKDDSRTLYAIIEKGIEALKLLERTKHILEELGLKL